jgi:uncharacterized membrane protein
VLSLTAWQLIAGGVVLAPVAVVVEPLPRLDGPAWLGFAYVTVVATALAFAAWFTGLRHLDAGTVGLVGLLNPVTGVLLGTVLAAESLSARQLCGLVLVLAGILVPSGVLHRPRRRSDGLPRRADVLRLGSGAAQGHPEHHVAGDLGVGQVQVATVVEGLHETKRRLVS